MSIADRFFGCLECIVDKIFDAMGVHDIEDASDFEEVPGTLRPIKREKLDTESMNLYIGKIIDDGNVKCEVVACEGDNFRIKILDIGWDRLGTYMDLGNTYNLLLCSDFNDFKVWEVDPEQMKRTASQVLLAWQGGSGWYWDLDS